MSFLLSLPPKKERKITISLRPPQQTMQRNQAIHIFDAIKPENLALLSVSERRKNTFGHAYYINFRGGNYLLQFPKLRNQWDVEVMTEYKSNGQMVKMPNGPSCAITKILNGPDDSMEARVKEAVDIVVNHLVGLLHKTKWMMDNEEFVKEQFRFKFNPVVSTYSSDEHGESVTLKAKIDLGDDQMPSVFQVEDDETGESIDFTNLVKGSSSRDIIQFAWFHQSSKNDIFLTRKAIRSRLVDAPTSLENVEFAPDEYEEVAPASNKRDRSDSEEFESPKRVCVDQV